MSFSTGTVQHMHKLRMVLGVTEDTKEGQIRRFALDIEEALDQLRARTLEVQQKARNPMIEEEDSDMEEVIAYVTELSTELQVCLKAQPCYLLHIKPLLVVPSA